MDMLMDCEVIRSEALLLLTFLTREAEEIQKIVVFEGAFEKIFSIIKEEGGSEGGGVVQIPTATTYCKIISFSDLHDPSPTALQKGPFVFIRVLPASLIRLVPIFFVKNVTKDCLELLNNLLRKSPSNQILLRETMGFEPIISALKLRGSAYNFTKQKTVNLFGALETIELLLMGGAEARLGRDANKMPNQTALAQKKLLNHLIVLGVESQWGAVAVRCAIHLRTNCAHGLMAPSGRSDHRTTLSTPQQSSPLSGKSGGPSSSISLMNQKLTLIKARRAARKSERASRGYCEHGNNQEATNGYNTGRVGGDNGGIEGRAEEATKLKQNKGKDIETEVNNNNEEFPLLTVSMAAILESITIPGCSAFQSSNTSPSLMMASSVSSISNTRKSGTRGIHATGVKKMRRHGAHADKPYYLHAKHMYNLDRMKYLRVKLLIFVFTCFSIGVVVLVYVIIFQQRKTAST
ncbi:hypothetical protein GIB67_009977 [Kingdonia uniflora]|uniref:Uncharacterized protein n=1 Tax=Kingdonia uniflora TaxID=39325 RepID=A0A7J7L9A5_9MAGN|nr:hypothetical protein GIB67_009977 [Kingdonia uniflora]